MTTAVFLAPLSVAGGPLFIPGTVSPAAGGQLFTYITGTSTKLPTYTTSSGAIANSNPIVLDSGGFVTGSGEVWLIQSSSYRFLLAPSTDTDPPASPYWTRDSISGINDVQTQINTAGQEWIAASTTPVFSNASSFTIGGDQTSVFTIGRRVKTTNSGGTVYGQVSSSAFATSTTVFIFPDSGSALDSGLSAVSYGLLSTPHGSVPFSQITSSGVQNLSTVTLSASSSAVWGSGVVNFGTVSKVKTSDETLTSTTNALHNDNTLFVPIKSNEQWVINFYTAFGDSVIATGLNTAISSIAGATTRVRWFGAGTVITESQVGQSNSGGGTFGLTPSSSAQFNIYHEVYIQNSTTTGNIQFQYSPRNNTSSALTCKTGSFLNATRTG